MKRLFSAEPCIDQENKCTIVMLFYIVMARKLHMKYCAIKVKVTKALKKCSHSLQHKLTGPITRLYKCLKVVTK